MATSIVDFLENELFSHFLFPLLLIFFVVFAVLDKTSLLGKDKKQLNALVSLVISLIFIGTGYQFMVSNLVLFLAIAVSAVFVILLLWGFVYGKSNEEFKPESWMKWGLGITLTIAFVLAVIWASGGLADKLFSSLSSSSVKPFITNLLFVVLIVVALAVALSSGGKKNS